jgi:hypothetical protein
LCCKKYGEKKLGMEQPSLSLGNHFKQADNPHHLADHLFLAGSDRDAGERSAAESWFSQVEN